MLFDAMFYYVFFLFKFSYVTHGETVTRIDNHYEHKAKVETNDHHRRFIEDLDDKEWHISHLREQDFDADCEGDTFDDKVNTYRKTLRNDAALVEFVSGDAMPYNKEDSTKDKCKNNITTLIKSIKLEKNKPKLKSNDTEMENDELAIKTATVSVKEPVSFNINPNITKQRRSEYQFSSVEYYDDVPDFDESVCPDAVEVITLELDTLRSYDVVCEATLEWRSLE